MLTPCQANCGLYGMDRLRSFHLIVGGHKTTHYFSDMWRFVVRARSIYTQQRPDTLFSAAEFFVCNPFPRSVH